MDLPHRTFVVYAYLLDRATAKGEYVIMEINALSGDYQGYNFIYTDTESDKENVLIFPKKIFTKRS